MCHHLYLSIQTCDCHRVETQLQLIRPSVLAFLSGDGSHFSQQHGHRVLPHRAHRPEEEGVRGSAVALVRPPLRGARARCDARASALLQGRHGRPAR